MKLFKTNSIDVVKHCQHFFGYELPSCLLACKFAKFIKRYNCAENDFCIFWVISEMFVIIA